MKNKLMIIAILVIVIVGVIIPFSFESVSAAQTRIILFPAIGKWYICQGYNTPEISHKNKDIYGFDLSPDKNSFKGSKGCSPATNKAASGRKIYAPASGTVTYLGIPHTDIMQLKLDTGGCIRIAHFASQYIAPKKHVNQGALIGTLSAPNAANGNYSHLHISVYSDTSCTVPVAFEEKSNFRIYGTNNFPKTTTKYAYRGQSISYQVPMLTPTKTATQSQIPIFTKTSTPTFTFTPIFTETLTPTSSPTNEPTTSTFTSTILPVTNTPTLTLTPTNTDTPTPLILQPILHYPGYSTSGSASACVDGNKWLTISEGYGDNAYLTLNVDTPTDTHTAYWYPDFVVAGQYKVEIFIANHQSITWSCNNSQISDDTSVAKYQVWHRDGKTTITVNQLSIANAWATLGTFNFDLGQQYSEYVKLANVTTDTNLSRFLSVSAIRFTYVGP